MGTTDHIYPKRDTRAYELLSLVAVCGDFPADLLERLPTSSSYHETVITYLKKGRFLKTYYHDRIRSYRLGSRAKFYLLHDLPERFSFFLSGNADTNLLKSEVTRRLRLHRIAEIYVAMLNAGVSIYRDRKPLIFSPGCKLSFLIHVPVFYNSREIKEAGIETIKIRGSRMTGVLLTSSGMYLTYNAGAGLPKWDYRAEYRAKVLLQIMLSEQNISFKETGLSSAGLLFGSGMEPFYQILSGADSGTRCFFLLDGTYEHFYYLSNDHRGDVLLKLLCSERQKELLDHLLSEDLAAKNPMLPFEHDALDKQGNPVLFGYLPDIPRTHRFLNALSMQERSGTLICFDFQKETYERLGGENLHLQTISFEKFERRFFPCG